MVTLRIDGRLSTPISTNEESKLSHDISFSKDFAFDTPASEEEFKATLRVLFEPMMTLIYATAKSSWIKH